MTLRQRPSAEASFAAVAQWIRTMVPGSSVDDRRDRQTLIEQILIEHRVWQRHYAWHTAQLDDGRVLRGLGRSTEEAELKLSVLHGLGCRWVVRDPELAVFFEYFPDGHRQPEDVNRVFALTPPRRPREAFSAATDPMAPVARDADTRAR